MKALAYLLIYASLGMMAYGLWMLSPALGVIVAGFFLLCFAASILDAEKKRAVQETMISGTTVHGGRWGISIDPPSRDRQAGR